MDPGIALIIAGVLATTLIAEIRLLRRDMRDRTPAAIAASFEQQRRRDRRRRGQLPARRRELASARDDDFAGEEDTDIHNLIELELEHQRARRKTGRQRSPGERPPRPGTHHD